MADYVNKLFDNDEARLFLSQEVLPAYQQAVSFVTAVGTSTNQPELLPVAFRWAKERRPTCWPPHFTKKKSETYTGLPDTLLKRESDLEFNLSRLLLRIDQAETSGAVRGPANRHP